MVYFKSEFMSIYKTKKFVKWQVNNNITDDLLVKACQQIENGLIDANLGANIYKQRLPKLGQGKSGGFRTIIATKIKDKYFFIFGFAKNESENISTTQKNELIQVGKALLNLNISELKLAIKYKEIMEVQS